MIYVRRIEIRRIRTVAGANDTIGLTGYSGAEVTADPSNPRGEVVLFTNIPASIQAGTGGRKRDSGLPQDIVSNPTWDIYVPVTALAKGAVRDRDIIIDDEQYRYEVGQAYWNILGYKLPCIRLEA
ncbi:hypothetical protein HAP48_0042450 [Bradyrhizobium septentrionale]|uniref:Uncharacterized protein n=1 Tax=Bradyrhizobium septentrionale TaxID=1404411 RepID=A0A973W2F3_9BRAD|nr:hypothetical protein [Bradyrhizobium septentrionale]UGY15120.1 hypothetical protein HAP48_0042450 [Bradyrhizobium septentrionale]